MAITSYQVDSVLNAYTKQNKIKISATVPKENVSEGKHKDVVSLSAKEDSRAEEFDIISCNLRDVIVKDNESSS
jgi:alpha-L-arabinofuranosidase